MGITPLGEKLRILRFSRGEKLLDMAATMEVSSAFISSIETGKKAPPISFEEHVIVCYELGYADAEELRQAADRSRKAFKLEPKTDLQRDTAGLMARKMGSLSTEELNNIISILNKNGGAK